MATSKPAAAGAGKKTQELDEKAIAFLTDRIKAEIESQVRFGQEWSELVPGLPRTIDDAIEAKRKELAELKAQAAKTAGAAAFTTTTRAQFSDVARPSPETGLGHTLGKR
jgi:hypothetical protein